MKKLFSIVLAASLLFSMALPSFAQAKIYERQKYDQLRALSQFTKNPLTLVVQHLAEKLVQNPKEFHLFYEQYIHELETISKKENELKVPFQSFADRLLFANPIFSVRDEKIYVLAAIRGKHFQTNLALIFSKDGNFEAKVEKDFEIKKLLTENEFKVNENWELKDIRRGLSLWPNFLVELEKEGSRLNFKPNQLMSNLHAKSSFKKQDQIKKKSFEPWVKAASILLLLNLTTLLTQGCAPVITEQSSMSVASFPAMNLYFTVIALILLNLYSLITKHQNYFPALVFYPYFSIKKVRLPERLLLSNLIRGKGNKPEDKPEGKPAQLNEIHASDGESELEPAHQTKINTKHITDGSNKVRLMDVAGVERLGIMGDVQGNYLQMLNALEKSGFIDSKGDWIAGSAVLIFDGDLIDGGPNPWEVLEFVYSLQNKASAQGGKVIAVMGNHEYMFINSLEGRDRYARELIWTHWLNDDKDMSGLNTLKKLLGREHLVPNWKEDPYAELGYAVQNREELLREIHERYPELNNILRWMNHSMPYAVRVNENVLAAHAAPDFYARTFEEIASSAKGELMTIQDREWVANSKRVKEWMKNLGIEYFVYGHTCQTPIGVGKNGGVQGKVAQIMPKIYNINTTPRQSAEGGAEAVLEFLFDRNLAHTVKVTYGENEFGLEDEIFEHYSVKVYRAFMGAAEKIGAKGLLDFIIKNIKLQNMVRQSSEGQVYKIEDLEDYELHFPRDIKFDDFKPVQDPFPNSNFGQAVAHLGSVIIHKRLLGVPYSVSSLSFMPSPTSDSLYEKHLEIAAGMAQSAYDNLAIDLKKIQDAGYTLDLTNSNNIFIDPEHSRFQPHQLILEKDDSLTHASRLAACLLNHEFAAEKYNGKDTRIFYWRRLILEKCLIAAQHTGLIFSNEADQNHALFNPYFAIGVSEETSEGEAFSTKKVRAQRWLRSNFLRTKKSAIVRRIQRPIAKYGFNPDSEMELAFESAGLKGEWSKVQSRMMKKIEVQKIFSDYPSTLPKKGLVLSSRQTAGLRGFEEIFYSALLVSGIGEIWNHLFLGTPMIGALMGAMISLFVFMKTHKKPIYLTSEGVLTHAPPLGMDEPQALARAKKILLLTAIALRTIYLLTLYLAPFGNIADIFLATLIVIIIHGIIYNAQLAPRYDLPLAMAAITSFPDQINSHIQKVHELNSPVDLSELWALLQQKDTGPQSKISGTPEFINNRNVARLYDEKFKELQAKYLGQLLKANQYFINVLQTIFALSPQDQVTAVYENTQELQSLQTFARNFFILSGLVSMGARTPLDIYREGFRFIPKEILEETKKWLTYYQFVSGMLPTRRSKFNLQDDRERSEIAVRSIKHGSWNELPIKLSVLCKALTKLDEPDRLSLEIEDRLQGIRDRLELYTERASLIFQDHELLEYREVLEILIGLLKNEISPRLNNKILIGLPNYSTLQLYYTRSIEIIEDLISFIDGNIEERKSTFGIKEVIEEALESVFNESFRERYAKRGNEIILKLEGFENYLIEIVGDRRKILNVFRTLFMNTRQVWQEKLQAEAKDNVPPPLPLQISVQIKWIGDKPIFEITDDAGGIYNAGLLDVPDSQEPDRQKLFFLNASGRKGGTGLGLAEVWHLIQLHSIKDQPAWIHASNVIDQNSKLNGAKFSIFLHGLIVTDKNKIDHQSDDPSDDSNMKILNKHNWVLSKARRELGVKLAGRGGGYLKFFKEKGLFPQLKRKIIERLIEHKGNFIKTAQSLGINELTLRNFRKELKIKIPRRIKNPVNKVRLENNPITFKSSMISDEELLSSKPQLKPTAKKKNQFIQGLDVFADMVLADMRRNGVNPEDFIKEAEKYAVVRMEILSRFNSKDRKLFAQYTDNKDLELIFKAMETAEIYLGDSYKNYFVGIVKDYFEKGSSFIFENFCRLDLWFKQNDEWNKNPFELPMDYTPREDDVGALFEELTGFSLESIQDRDGVLSIPYVYYAMQVRKSVNPEHNPLVAVYGGAGADISTFLLSVNASISYFVTQNQVDAEQLKNMMEQWDSITFDDDYAKDKRLYGFGNGGTLDKKKGAIYKAIVQELKTIEVRKESVRIENKDGHTQITFDWVYPGTNQPRTYSITYIGQRLQKLGSPETTDPLLNAALEKGIDIYYQKAVQDTNNLWGQFLSRIAKAIRAGGYSITDDSQSSGIHNPEPFLNTESDHFVSLKQNSSKKIFDWWKKIIPSKSNYGWDVTIRIKKEQPQQQPITAAAKPRERTSGVKAEDLSLVALADLVATDMVMAHIPPEKFAEKAEEYTIARIVALSKMDPKWLEEARDFTIIKNLKLIYNLLPTPTRNLGDETQVQLAGLIKAYFESKDFKALLPQFKQEYDHVPSNFFQWLNKNKKIVQSKRFKKRELSKIVSRITGFDPKVIKDWYSILLLPYVHYAMSVCEIVNPDHKDLVGVYGGAGADISSFLLSTDVGTGYFVTNNRVDSNKLQSCLREWDFKTVESAYTDQEYTYKKRLKGFGEGTFLQNTPDNIYWAIAAELKSMGVDLNAIEVELDQGHTKSSFNWAHPITNKNRKYTIVYINSNVESIGNKKEANDFLNKILDSGIDFYYEKAGMNIHKSWGEFLPRIAEAVKLDGMAIICDFDGDERPIDSMPHLQKLGSKFVDWGSSYSMRWWRMFIPSDSGYGWEVKIRKKIRNSIAIQFDTTEWDNELLEFYKLGEIEKLQKIVLEESDLRRMAQAMKAFEYFLQEDLSYDFGRALFSSIHEINNKKPLAISQSLVSVLEDVLRRGELSDINSEQAIRSLMWIMMKQPHLISESIRETLEILLERKNLSSLEFAAIEDLVSLAIAEKRPDRISSLFVIVAMNILNTDNIFWVGRMDSLFYSSACDILETIAKHRPDLIFDPMIVRALERVFSYDGLEPFVYAAAAQAIEAIVQIHPDFITANTLSVLNSFIHTAIKKRLESYVIRHINHAILEIIKKRGNLLFNPDLLSTQEEILRANGQEDEVYKSAAEFIDIIAENRSSFIQVSTVESLIQSLQRKDYVEAHFADKDKSTTHYGVALGAFIRILKFCSDLVELERLVEVVIKFLKNSERIYPHGFFLIKQIVLKAPKIFQTNHMKILESHARRILKSESAHHSQFLKPIADCFKEVSRARPDLIQSSTVSLLSNLLKIKDLRPQTYMAVLDTFKNLIQKRPKFNKAIFSALEYLMMQKRHEAEEYRYAANLMKKIIKAEPKLENGSVLYPVIKTLPEKILGHPFHHWRIYTDNYFRAWMEKYPSNSEAYSVANAVYELLTFSNLRFSKQNIKKGLDLILVFRRVLSLHVDNLIYRSNVTAINILHQDQEYRKESMETVQILAGVKPEQIKTFKGFEQKENALEAIRQSKGPTTIYIHAHGDGEGFSLDSKEVSSQNSTNQGKRPIDEPYSISHSELVDTLLERGSLSEVKIIFDCCYPYDLSRTFISYLTERYMSDPDIRTGCPFIITANGEGRFIYTGIFAEGLRSVQEAGSPLYVDDIFQAEDVMFEYEDPIIMLPIDSSLFGYMQSKIPKILYSPLLIIGSIFGEKHKDTARYWEWVYQTPALSIFSNAIARAVGKKLGIKRIRDQLGEAPYSKTISFISSLVLISSFLTGHNFIIIAASVLWSLASGYVFSGAHKGRESFNLQVVGSILAGATIAPAILFSLTLNWLGLELPFVVNAITYVVLLVIGIFWNIHLHKEYNENIDEIFKWLEKNSPYSLKRFLPSHLSPAIIFSEPSRLKQVEWVKKLYSEENRNLNNPMELALFDLLDFLDAESFFEEYWWWANYLSAPENSQFSEDDLTRAFNSYLTELDEVEPLIGNDLNETELEDFNLFILLNQVEILKSRIELRWKEFGLSHINRVVYQRIGRVFPIDVMISNLNELNPYRDSSEPNSIPEELNSLFAKHEDFSHFVERSRISYFGPLSLLQERLQTELKQRILADTALIHKLVRLSSEQFFMLSDPIMDWILNMNVEWVETTTNYRVLQDRFAMEQVTYEGTPYHKIRELLPALNLSSSDTLYDLGSGYGRLPLYAAMTTKIGKVKGVEISLERVAESNRVKNQLGLENVEFIPSNVRDYDFSDGTVFYLFNPFNDETLGIVVNKLKETAQKKKIRIISWGRSTSYFNQQDWLKPIATVGSGPWPMVLYESMLYSANPEVNILESKILSKKIIKGILHLESFLDDPDIDVRRMANDVTQRIQAAFMLKKDTPSLSSILEDKELKSTEQSLKSHDEEARCRAILSLKKHYLVMIRGGEIPDLTLLEERLSDPDFSVRRTAAIALGYLYTMQKKETSQLEKYLEDDEWRRLIGVIALGETFASNIREGKVLEEDYQKYLLWKANSLPYQEELVTDYLESQDSKNFIDALKRKAEKIIREGFNYHFPQNVWLAFLGTRFNGIHISWKDFVERMDDVIEYDQDVPGVFRALFSKTKGLKPIEISDKESKQIDTSQINANILDEHLHELLEIEKRTDTLQWLKDFQGDKDFNLRNLYFIFKREQAIKQGGIREGERYRVHYPSNEDMAVELRIDLKLLYKIAFQLAYKKMGDKTLREKCVSLLRDLTLSEALSNSELVSEMLSSNIETRIIAIKNFYEDSVHHLPNDAVGLNVKQIKSLDKSIKELSKAVYAEIKKVIYIETTSNDTYRLIPQGFLSLFRGRAGISDCSFDRERGFPHTRAMQEDTLYYFVYKGKELKGYVGLMMGIREDGEKVLTIDTINSPSLNDEDTLINLFNGLHKVAQELGAIGIALPENIKNTQYFNFENKNVISKMGLYKNGKKINVKPVHRESWNSFTEKFGEDRYNSMEAGDFILLDLTNLTNRETNAATHLRIKEEMSSFFSNSSKNKEEIENYLTEFKRDGEPLFKRSDIKRIMELSWIKLAKRAGLLEFLVLFQIDNGFVFNGNQIAMIMDNAKSPEVIVRTIRFLVQEGFSDGAHISLIVSHPRDLKQIKRFINYLVQAAIENKSHMSQIMSSSMNLKEVRQFINRLYKLGFTNSSHLSQILGSSKDIDTINAFIAFLNVLGIEDHAQISRILRRERYLAGIKKVVDALKAEGILDKFQIRSVVRSTIAPAQIRLLLNQVERMGISEIERMYGKDNQGQLEFYSAVFPKDISKMSLSILYLVLPKAIRSNKRILWTKLSCGTNDAKILAGMSLNDKGEIKVADLRFPFQDYKGYEGFNRLISQIRIQSNTLLSKLDIAKYLSSVPDQLRKEMHWYYSPILHLLQDSIHGEEDFTDSSILGAGDKKEETIVLGRIKEALGENDYHALMDLLRNPKRTAQEREKYKGLIRLSRVRIGLERTKRLKAGIIPFIEDWWMQHFPKTPKPVYRLVIAPLFTEGAWLNLAPLLAGELLLQAGLGIVPTGVLIFLLNILVGARFIALHPVGSRAIPIFIVVMNSIVILYFYPFVQWHSKEVVLFNAYLAGTLTHTLLNAFQIFIDWANETPEQKINDPVNVKQEVPYLDKEAETEFRAPIKGPIMITTDDEGDVLTYRRNPAIDITDPMVRRNLKNEVESSKYRSAVLSQFFTSEACEYFDSLVKEDMWNSLGAWKFLREIYRRFGSLKGKTVIDLYAGPGVSVEQLIRLGGVNALGIDTDKRFVEFAKEFGIPIIHGTLLKEDVKTAVEELIGKRKVALTFSYGLLNNISNRKKRIKILRSISSLTPVGSFSIHGTKKRFLYTDEEFKSAGFQIIEINKERTFVVLFKENEPEDWDAIGFNPLFDDTEEPEDDKEDKNSDKTDESSAHAILSATISALPIFLEPITSSSFYFGQNSWDRLTLETQQALRKSFHTEPSSNYSISQWLGSSLAIEARINKNPFAINLLNEKINFASSLLQWNHLGVNQSAENIFTLFRKPNWLLLKAPNLIFKMGGIVFRGVSSASNVGSSIEMLARNLNEKVPETINQKDSIKITVSYQELEKFSTIIKKLSDLFEEKQIELLVVTESSSLKEEEIKGELMEKGIENLKFRVLIQPKKNGKFDFQELIDTYELFSSSLILLSGADEWNLDHVLKEIIRIDAEPFTHILNIEMEKIQLITYSA